MKRYIFGLIAALSLGYLSSCNSLDVTPPNSITDEQVMDILKNGSESDINMILKAIGSSLHVNFNLSGKTYTGYSYYSQNSQVDQDFLRSMMGNDVVHGTLATSGSGLGTVGSSHGKAYSLITSYRQAENDWPFFALPAEIITAANKALNYLTPEAARHSPMVKLYRGRGLAVRAYGYMQLMERFQRAYTNGGEAGRGMPIYTEYKINDPAPVASAAETYNFILGDLKEAVSALSESGYTPNEYNDIDLGVAQFLLARAALWYGDWQTCINTCNDLVAHYPDFIKEENYGSVASDEAAIVAGTKDCKAEDNAFFSLSVNPEAIMGFKNGDGANTYFYNFTNVYAAGEAGYNGMPPCIDSRLYYKIDTRDFRKARFTTEEMDYTYIVDQDGRTEVRTIEKYANLKFAATVCLGATGRTHQMSCDNVVFRSSEAYLMLAEAYARNGNEVQAKEALNKLLAARTKAGAETLTCDNYAGMGGMTALQMVQLQSRIELWCEGGREYYNNKRWNIPVDRGGSENHHQKGALSVDDMTIEIPAREASANPNWANIINKK